MHTFFTRLDSDLDVIVGVRAYFDTADGYQALVPAVLAAAQATPGGSAISELLRGAQ